VSELVLSLFPGIGLLDMAFEQEGFCVVRGPDLLWGGDIRSFHPPAGMFTGIIGGPPCQCWSPLANLVRASGREPRFGNLIPEFERVVLEANPAWFLMENVPGAPPPWAPGFGIAEFLFDNAWLGEEQKRKRRLCFGLRGRPATNLMRWIQQAPLELPRLAPAVLSDLRQTPVRLGGTGRVKVQLRTVSQWSPDNTDQAKGRCKKPTVRGPGGAFPRGQRKAVISGGGPTLGHRIVAQAATVTGSVGGDSKRRLRFKYPDACRLQGLPENFLEEAPFTAGGKLKAVANGVPLPMGRAVAKAVRKALTTSDHAERR
jgi:site-specific DNA-cytosine methylase